RREADSACAARLPRHTRSVSVLEADKDSITAYYAQLLDRFGPDARACDYGRPESQRIKFEVLARAEPLGPATVLDVGCGLADYAGFLAERRPRATYTGVDVTPRMIDEARRAHPGLALDVADILMPDFTTHFDVVTANGIFYLLSGDALQKTMRLVQ